MRQQTAERDLVGRMRARDGSAVTDLASLYGPRIQQLAFRYLRNWEDAEEVAQDVLLKVYRKIEDFRGEAARLHLGHEGATDALVLRGRIAQASYPGGVWRYAVAVGEDHFLVDDARRLEVGAAASIALPRAALHLYAMKP